MPSFIEHAQVMVGLLQRGVFDSQQHIAILNILTSSHVEPPTRTTEIRNVIAIRVAFIPLGCRILISLTGLRRLTIPIRSTPWLGEAQLSAKYSSEEH